MIAGPARRVVSLMLTAEAVVSEEARLVEPSGCQAGGSELDRCEIG